MIVQITQASNRSKQLKQTTATQARKCNASKNLEIQATQASNRSK